MLSLSIMHRSALNYSRQEIIAEGVFHLIPTKKPGTTIRLAAREGDQSGLFDYTGVQDPRESDLNKLVGLATKKGVHTCMSNHYYTFQGEIRRQEKGGSIGSELTGEVSNIYMLRWDSKFLSRLKKLGVKIHMYTRYVDDTLIILDEFTP